jgi:hypothetical protein
VAHASELKLLFGPIPAAAQIETDFANQMLDFYLNFVNDLNPGREYRLLILLFNPNFLLAAWPAYSKDARNNVLQLLRDNITMIPDGNTSLILSFRTHLTRFY